MTVPKERDRSPAQNEEKLENSEDTSTKDATAASDAFEGTQFYSNSQKVLDISRASNDDIQVVYEARTSPPRNAIPVQSEVEDMDTREDNFSPVPPPVEHHPSTSSDDPKPLFDISSFKNSGTSNCKLKK